MLIWAVIGIGLGFVMGWDNYAHIGGFIGGAGLAYIITAEEPTVARSALIWNIIAITCALVVVVSFGMVAKNYGNSQRKEALRRSYNSVQRLEGALIPAFKWRGRPEDGDSQVLASRLRTAASGVERVSGIDDPRADEVCKRLVDLAGKRAAVLDEAKTNLQAITPENSNYRDVEVALDNYLAWWEARAEEIGLK